MPITINPPQQQLQWEPTPNRKLWTRAECEKLVNKGIIKGRYELVDGEIISKMGQKRKHALAVALVTNWLMRVFGGLRVQCQLPIDVSVEDRVTNEPEPDVVVLSQATTEYLDNHPGPGAIELAVEIADTSLSFDLRKKASLYARTGIPEYWVLDIVGRRLMCHRNPETGQYKFVQQYSEEEFIAPIAKSDSSIRVSDLLPPI
jgi:Uma2 family endonuclease